MNLKSLFRKTNKREEDDVLNLEPRPEVPEGLYVKCNKCGATVSSKEMSKALKVCPKCGQYNPLSASERIKLVTDKGSFKKFNFGIEQKNPLNVEGYPEKLEKAKKATGLDEAVVSGYCKIGGLDAVIAVMDGRFMMASMGSFVGEHLARTIDEATTKKLPLVIFAASGGARMQEGIVSLMQMAKTSAAIKKHKEAGLLYISVLTDPTTGGVTASFASLGDIILAEPKALIGFAGPRVIEQTIGQSLPEGFQRSEFLLEKGFVDKIVKRKNLKKVIGLLLQLHVNDGNEEASVEGLNVAQKTLSKAGMLGRISKAGEKPEKSGDDLGGVSTFFKKIFHKKGDENKELSPWEIVQLSRDSKRPVATEYIKEIFEDFIQLHGDRLSEDDKAIVGGIGRIGGRAVTVIGQAKGRNTEENIKRNFGMPSPSGYRKALRLMKEAERFGRPIINIIDTPGAYCGISAEEQGQGEAIARNLMEMSSLKVPVLSIVIGEAGSGGALAMAVANEVYMMENSIYSILSPEGYASILWKDGKRASEAAAEMKLTAKDLLELGIIEDIIAEPKDFSREKIKGVASAMAMRIKSFIERYDSMSGEELAAHRYDRFAAM